MKKTLGVGLIGFGMIGKVHAYGYATLPYYAPDLDATGKIVAVATSNPESARRAQETIGCVWSTDDFRKLIASPEIDVVHVCSPNDRHLPALLAAIRANKHIYCEKPVVANAQEAKVLREELAKRGDDGKPLYRGTTATAFHMRGFTAIRRAKELIEEGKLGQIIQYRLGYYHSSMLSPTAPFRWKHEVGGGSILDLASHLLDLIDYLVGLPAELMAQSTTLCPTRLTRPLQQSETFDDVSTRPVMSEDSVTFLTRGLDVVAGAKTVPNLPTSRVFEHPANVGTESSERLPLAVADPSNPAAITGVIEATKLTHGAEDDLKLEINGTRGSLRFSLMNSHYLEYFDATAESGVNGGNSGWLNVACGGRYAKPESEFPSPKSATGWVRAHVSSLATFYRSIADGRSYGADIEQALRIQDALDVVKRSAAARRWETL